MKNRSLLLQQMGSKMQVLLAVKKVVTPPTGWVGAVRLALGMSSQQLGRKLSITRQSALAIERREREGSITLKALREAAAALDMELVYGFVPKDGSLDALIERKARELATQIVMRTATTMQLEDQANSKERLQQAIEERTQAIKHELPKLLWD